MDVDGTACVGYGERKLNGNRADQVFNPKRGGPISFHGWATERRGTRVHAIPADVDNGVKDWGGIAIECGGCQSTKDGHHC